MSGLKYPAPPFGEAFLFWALRRKRYAHFFVQKRMLPCKGTERTPGPEKPIDRCLEQTGS
jgi:hypothetical protein